MLYKVGKSLKEKEKSANKLMKENEELRKNMDSMCSNYKQSLNLSNNEASMKESEFA